MVSSGKILVLDIDGTLTNSRKEITAATREALLAAQKRGHKIVLASGRPDGGMEQYARELELDRYDGYLLPFNGARIVECATGKVLHQVLLPSHMIPVLCEFIKERDCGLMTYYDQQILTAREPDEYILLDTRVNHIPAVVVEPFEECCKLPVNKCLVTARPELAEELEKILAVELGEEVSIYRSEPFYVEVMPKGVDKATSLERLLGILGASRDDLICCGDGYNDVSMIRYGGVGVAMGNARDPVKAEADYITGSNEEDGLVEVVDLFLQ